MNEFHFNYNREAQRTFQHPGEHQPGAGCLSCGAFLADRCARFGALLLPPPPDGAPREPRPVFIPAWGRTGKGFRLFQLSGGFTIGNNAEGELPQVGNSFQLVRQPEARSWEIIRLNSVANIRRQRFDQTLYYNVSGTVLLFRRHVPAILLALYTGFPT